MVKVSIICLIYKSTKLMDAVYESAIKYTPMLKNGEAEFLFVANDPTDNVVKHLIDKKYSFIISKNKHHTDEELFKMGYGIPEYINRVYKGYNQGILHAKGEKIVLINSDNFFSDNWLENLLKNYDFKKVVVSQLVERNHEKFGVFPGAIEKYFGDCVENYEDEKFNAYANSVKKDGLKEGGAYMPCLLSRDAAIYAGLYPGGNIAGKNKETIIRYGDECFYDKLKSFGVKHYTALDSIVYHLKEGEREEKSAVLFKNNIEQNKYIVKSIPTIPVEKYKKMYLPLLGNPHGDKVLSRILLEVNPFNKVLKSVEELFSECIFSKKKIGNKRTLIFFNFIKISYKKHKNPPPPPNITKELLKLQFEQYKNNALNIKKSKSKDGGWLINDILTCIPNTKTFWHDLIENIEGLEDRTYGYTDFKVLAELTEKRLFLNKIIPWAKKPKYIIRNATYFRPIKTKIPQICLLQDFYNEEKFLKEQLPVLKSCKKTVINSNYIFNKVRHLLPDDIDVTVIPMGVDSEFFNPDMVNKNDMFEGVKDIKENSILFIGSNQDWPKGFNLLMDVVEKTNYNFVFVMKYDFKLEHPRVTVFNRLNQKNLRDVMASCKMVLCTSKMETFHLAGVESMLMDLPCVATNVGVYTDFDDGKWGVKCTPENIVEKIDYVFNKDGFTPRQYILDRKLNKKSTMTMWKDLVKSIVS